MSLLDGPFAPRTVSIDITFLVRQALAAASDDPATAVGEPGASSSDPDLREGPAHATG